MELIKVKEYSMRLLINIIPLNYIKNERIKLNRNDDYKVFHWTSRKKLKKKFKRFSGTYDYTKLNPAGTKL
jgi:hypothetical protein